MRPKTAWKGRGDCMGACNHLQRDVAHRAGSEEDTSLLDDGMRNFVLTLDGAVVVEHDRCRVGEVPTSTKENHAPDLHCTAIICNLVTTLQCNCEREHMHVKLYIKSMDPLSKFPTLG